MRIELDDTAFASSADDAATLEASSPGPAQAKTPATGTPRIVNDVLIEEVSIDGMCGVY
jgi:mycofactocin precursor